MAQLTAIAYSYTAGGALFIMGMCLMKLADRKNVGLFWMTLEVTAAALSYIIAFVFLVLGTYSLAASLWNLGH